jgi:alkylation response protein AidB-like acyl-CoA dehydrogenase
MVPASTSNGWSARAHAPLVARYRDEAERGRRLPRELFEPLRDAGFFRLWTPRSLGGEEVSIETAARVTEELKRAGTDPWAGT